MKVASCGKDTHDRSSVRCIPSGFNDSNSNSETRKFNKSFSKVRIKFIQWLRHKRVNTVKYFKSESKWKGKYDDQENKLHAKRDDSEHNEHEQDKSNL